ncbi:SAVED domain-containing protein [Mesorhizobium sp. M0701]|uniref:SAVED domain-containing protein n=1 Tax=Mesorhizobium sp. M0701 TaxID=2956989 RepID=UPI0033359E32
MADQVLARQQGDDFQARIFWLEAANLLRDESPVRMVMYETGPKAFDDVVVDYTREGAPQDHFGKPILRDHKQCKWHVRPGDFGFNDFTIPEFIGGTSVSFLQRARAAQLAHAPSGEGARFHLVTNWAPKEKDPLRKLILNQTNALDIDLIFVGGANSMMGQLRDLWSGHLQIDNDELRRLLRTLGVNLRIRSGEDLREQLNDRFAAVGMRTIPRDEAGFSYDDLIRKLHAQGRKTFDRKTFRELVNDEKLLAGPKDLPKTTIGVRSFMHPIDSIEARATTTLNLVPYFDGRFLKDEASWETDLFPALQSFVLAEAQKGDHMRLILDAHVSLAFAVGSILNVKAGKSIEVEQRTNGRRFWSRDDIPLDLLWPGIDATFEELGAGSDLAVAIGLTHDVAPMVREFLKAKPEIGKLVVVRLAGGASGASVKSGSHAVKLAEEVVTTVRNEPGPSMLHLFIAAPNGFTFFLGQHQAVLGAATVYEWDFEGTRSKTYSKGLTLRQAG